MKTLWDKLTFTGEENDDGYFSLTTTFSLKPTNQTSNPLSGVLIGISENSMETTGIILLKQVCNQANIWLWFERLKIPTKTDFNKCIFFSFEKLLKIWLNIKKIHKPALVISRNKIGESWNNDNRQEFRKTFYVIYN